MDFYLTDRSLIVEVGGPYHNPEKDHQRDAWFTRVRGIPILQLSNEQVLAGEYPDLRVYASESLRRLNGLPTARTP